MLDLLDSFFRDNVVGMVFTVLGLGYLVGRLSFKGFDLGSVSGVLFVGLVFGHFGYTFPATTQSIGFVLFIFSVGLQAGPSFFSVLRQDGARYFTLALLIGGTGFGLAWTFAKLMDLAPGAAAGLLAGGLTSSPTLAAAQDAVRGGQVPVPEGFTSEQVMTNVTTAYAITYIFGLVGLIVIIRLLPRALGIDLRAEAARLETGRTGAVEDRAYGVLGIQVRAFRMTNDQVAGMTVRDLHERYPGGATFEKIRRDGQFIDVDLDTELQVGDEVCAVGRMDAFVSHRGDLGEEIYDAELLDVPVETCRVVALRSKLTRLEFTAEQGVANAGCFLGRLVRNGVDVPHGDKITVLPGDVLHVTGPRMRLEKVGANLGHIERESEQTDLITFALGIAVGLAIGTLTVTIGGVSVGLGSAGGLLATGLVIGYLRALHPTFGRLPAAARWIFMELGLLLFMAGVGLRAGSGIVETVLDAGPSMFLAGLVVTVVPVLLGYWFGTKVLRINPVLLLGAITGSMTSGASLSVVTQAADSQMPALGYTGAYAFANVMLTIAGALILLL